MERKIDAGALLVSAAALLLIVSLFLDWFGIDGDAAASAFEVFEVLDLVLLAAAGAAIAAALGRLDSRVLLGAAILVVVVVVTQLIEPPPAGQGADRELGIWLALVAAGGLLAGAALLAAQIAVTVDVRGRERRRRVATVDKREGAAPREAAATPTPREPTIERLGERDQGGAVLAASLRDDRGDAFAPPARPVAGDPDATQAFVPDEPPR